MRIIGLLWSICILIFTLVTIIYVTTIVYDVITICDDENLQTKKIIVVNKFIVNKGLDGDCFYFLDEMGVDYRFRGEHKGARYTKLKLNQSYQIWVNVEKELLGGENVSCKEVLVCK